VTPPRARLAAALLGCAWVASGGPARAIEVTSAADAGAGTLRAAITFTNGSPDDTITFNAVALQNATITLASPLPDVTGPLTINGGTQNVTIAAAAGQPLVTLATMAGSVTLVDLTLTGGQIVVQDKVALKMNQGVMMGTFTNLISGAGSLEKLGANELFLTGQNGPNTYAGGTTVTAGELRGNTNSLRGNILVSTNGTLDFFQESLGEYSGVLSGNGTLQKTGASTLILSGDSQFDGTTSVLEGILQGDASSLTGAIDVADVAGVELIFDQTGSGSYAGALTGGANSIVRKSGTGTLTLAGDTSGFLGTLVFEDGTLVGTASTLPQQIENAGNAQTNAVVFSQDSAGSYTGTIEGPGGTSSGGVSKVGSADLTLAGTSVIRSAIFTLGQGSLSLASGAVFDGELRVSSGTTLQGESAAADVTGSASVDGTVSPGGGGVGILATSFDAATFHPSSGLLISISELAGEDRFEATSVVVEPGARLTLSIQGDPNVAMVPVLVAPGGITGTFVFDQDFCFFTETVDQQANQILVSISSAGSNCIQDEAVTPNQQAVAQVLTDAQGNGDLADFFDAIRAIEDTQVPALLDALSGEIYSAFVTPRLAAKRRLDRAIETRVRGFASQAPGVVPERRALSSAAPQPRLGIATSAAGLLGVAAGPDGALFAFTPAPDEGGLGAWIDGYGVFGSVDGSAGAADVDYGVYGTTLGLDWRLSKHFLLGAAAGYARLEPEISGRSEDAFADVGQGALFAAGVWERVHLAGWGRYAFGGYQVERRIAFDSLNTEAEGDFDGWELSGHGELGVRALDLAGIEVRPFGSVDYAYLEQDGISETGAVVGADSLNLVIPGESWSSFVSGLGASAQAVWEMDEGLWLVPELHGRWIHEFGDTDRRVTPTLTGAGLAYSPFIGGAESGRDGFVGGLGWGVSSETGLHAFADYEIGWVPDLLQHTIKAGFTFVF
jgi:autotransporter-associated beta strand protein